MRRVLANVPALVDLETDGEVWCTIPLDEDVRRAVLVIAVNERQSIDTALERLFLRAMRNAIRGRATLAPGALAERSNQAFNDFCAENGVDTSTTTEPAPGLRGG